MMARNLARLASPLILTTTVCHASSPLTPGGANTNRPYMPPPPGAAADHQLRPRFDDPMPTSIPPAMQEQQDMGAPPDTFDAPGDHIAVEERLSAWRQQQQDRYEHYTPEQLNSIVDDEGRTKLLTTMSRTSVPIMFFILLTRSIHHFELADASFKGMMRLLFVLPTVLLFLGNLSGVVVGALTSIKGTGGTKRRLKAILNLNKLLEIVCMFYNVIRLAAAPSRFVPREVYVARTVTNFMFLSFCQVYTKVTWGGIMAKDPVLAAADTSYGDSYYGGTEEEEQQYGRYEQQQQQQQQQQYGQRQYGNEDTWR